MRKYLRWYLHTCYLYYMDKQSTPRHYGFEAPSLYSRGIANPTRIVVATVAATRITDSFRADIINNILFLTADLGPSYRA